MFDEGYQAIFDFLNSPLGGILLIFLTILGTVLAPFIFLIDLLTPPYDQA